MEPEYKYDSLTGLLSRRDFQEAFSAHLVAAKSKNHETPLSVAMIDIDHFLEFNETYGHAGGDAALVELSAVLKDAAGDAALAARYGGDEFAMLFPGKEREQVFLILENIRQAMCDRAFHARDGRQVNGLSISGGLATFPVDGRTEYELLRKASQALYRAKMAHRGQIRLAYEERMVPKTAHFTQTQLERLGKLAEEHNVNEADLLREAVDDLLTKYEVNDIET